jgi:HPt (histidine-containing phosphotransfer) domain-containing protein
VPNARSASGSAVVLDVDHLDAMCGEDPALERELLQNFLITTESRMLLLRDAIGAGDAIALASAARTLGASSRGIGARALADSCLELESLGVRGRTGGAVAAFAHTRRQHRKLRAAIASRLARRSA